jgi:D-3-phosphoglycerate dehydrogenase
MTRLKVRAVDMDTLLAESDAVSVHVPLSPETRGIIGERALARMKPTAFLINTSRGGLVDEQALAAALTAGQLAGAALDVVEKEPPPPDHPLRKAPNVILTPHLGASTKEAQTRVALEIAEAVRDALLKGDLRSAVNLSGLDAASVAANRPLMDLSERLGKLGFAMCTAGVESVDVTYYGTDDHAADSAGVAVLKGVLSQMGIERVTLVNAAHIARQRGIRVTRRAEGPREFEQSVGVEVASNGKRVRVRGALFDEAHARVVSINGRRMDLDPSGAIVVLTNRDVPGVIGKVGTILGAAGINISDYHQSRPLQSGDDALAAIAVDVRVPQPVLDELRRLPDTSGVWQVDLGA